MEKYKVLITSIGSTTSIGITKFIRKSAFDVFIVGTDINEYNRIAGSVFCDKFYKIVPFFNENYISSIIKIIQEHSIQILIPVHDQEVEILSKQKEELKALGCFVITSSFSSIEKTNNKLVFAEALKNAGILVPETFSVNDWLLRNKSRPQGKWLLKPVSGVSSRGIIIADADELQNVIAARSINEGYIVQEFITGIEYTVDVFVKDKIPYCTIPRIREEVREGLCYKASTLVNKDFLHPVKGIISLFDFYGPINIQFIKDNTSGHLYCIECNPRFGGSSVISLYAGVNLFDFIIKDYQKENLEIKDSYKLVYMTRYWEEVFYEI